LIKGWRINGMMHRSSGFSFKNSNTFGLVGAVLESRPRVKEADRETVYFYGVKPQRQY
jgi:hypothetical protein